MPDLLDKLATLIPELIVLTGAMLCLVVGLTRSLDTRRAAAAVAFVTLLLAALVTPMTAAMTTAAGDLTTAYTAVWSEATTFAKLATTLIGALLVLIAAYTPEQIAQVREADAVASQRFRASETMRGEFFAFMLFSLCGVMLVAGAGDLAWLFLSLELVSLPTYVLVATSRDRAEAHESGVKYFFLGAVAAAVFLYGFAFLYGATGFTDFDAIRATVADQIAHEGAASPLLTLGLALAILGIAFKIAAFPMHFYAADVYQGAAGSVTAFLSFVPKAAGVLALFHVLGLVGWANMPAAIAAMLAAIAALTMTLGNVLALLQTSVKRALAYSSVAHSGYLLLGLLAGPGLAAAGIGAGGTSEAGLSNGLMAALFYLVVYGVASIAAFGVLASIRTSDAKHGGDEADTYDDIAGLIRTAPGLAVVLTLAMLSLIGLPPLAGLLGKVYLFGSALTNDPGLAWLVVVAVVNSAISAVYYLRIAAAALIREPVGTIHLWPAPMRHAAVTLAGLATVLLSLAGGSVIGSGTQPPSATADATPPRITPTTQPTAVKPTAPQAPTVVAHATPQSPATVSND